MLEGECTTLHTRTQHPTHTPHTSPHRTRPPNMPTPTQLDSEQSLTPHYALQLSFFPWLTAAQH